MSAATPDVAGLLAQLGAGGAQPPNLTAGGTAPPAADPLTPGDTPDQQNGGDPLDLLRQMIQDAQAFIAVAPHEQDKAVVAQCLAQYQKLLAQDEQEQQAAMQGKVSARQLHRAAAAQGGGAQGGAY